LNIWQFSFLEDQGFATPIQYQKYCKGRLCANCGKCRDWYYTGDLATWRWIQDYKNWQKKDEDRWYNDEIYKRFQKRGGATCTYGYLGLGLVYGHHLGCVCEDNRRN
jgi:hypothetical protein